MRYWSLPFTGATEQSKEIAGASFSKGRELDKGRVTDCQEKEGVLWHNVRREKCYCQDEKFCIRQLTSRFSQVQTFGELSEWHFNAFIKMEIKLARIAGKMEGETVETESTEKVWKVWEHSSELRKVPWDKTGDGIRLVHWLTLPGTYREANDAVELKDCSKKP